MIGRYATRRRFVSLSLAGGWELAPSAAGEGVIGG
jgi:hypothetical protein